MGLLDVISGMQNESTGQRTPAPAGASGGMSPILMAILGLIAYKAVKHLTAGQPNPASPTPAALLPPVRRAGV